MTGSKLWPEYVSAEALAEYREGADPELARTVLGIDPGVEEPGRTVLICQECGAIVPALGAEPTSWPFCSLECEAQHFRRAPPEPNP